MRTSLLRNLGIAAVVMLAPGGFILGATLAANHYRKRAAARRDPSPIDDAVPVPPA